MIPPTGILTPRSDELAGGAHSRGGASLALRACDLNNPPTTRHRAGDSFQAKRLLCPPRGKGVTGEKRGGSREKGAGDKS